MRSPSVPPGGSGQPQPDRRDFLRLLGVSGIGALLAPTLARAQAAAPAVPVGAPEFYSFPEKVSLKMLTDQPAQLETPIGWFRTDFTPNEAFYVRSHLANLPTRADTAAWRLNVGGHVDKPATLSLDDLRKMPAVEIAAVNQCSGNSRSFFKPAVPGVQWGNGAMGNAKWKGVRLRDVLQAAGMKAGAVEVQFDGQDAGVIPATPDYQKAIPLPRAMHEDTLLAYEMNGAPLPLLNGFPLRLIVPGWYATYWMKWVTDIKVNAEPLANFWMKPAYRIPSTPDANESPADLAKDTVPIHRMNVRSLIVAPTPEQDVPINQPFEISGIAFDGGDGIAKVEVSTDGGATWAEAKLGPDHGKYSFRRFLHDWKPAKGGVNKLMSRATTKTGAVQPAAPIWNRSGYMRNVVETTLVFVS